jgi:xyloglucan-specific exo-beta-1,4-glucanase
LASDLRFEQISFGNAASPAGYPTLFAIATRNSRRGIYRSNDCGVSFEGVTDEEHEYGGRYRVILADQMVVDRVYVGTDGRGLLVADGKR